MGNPAVTPAPSIDYDLSIQLREDGYYFVEGVWDGFPAIEVFMEDMATGKVDLIYEKRPTHTRGKQGNEYTGGQIFKLIDVIGDERFTLGNFFGYKPQVDKGVSPYAKDIEKMKVIFELKNGFDGD